MTRYIAHFSGHVQGVGFRMTVQQIARRYAVSGYVQNLTDGRVRLVAEGEEEAIRRFLENIQERMTGHIDNTQIDIVAAQGDFEGFEIRQSLH